MSSIIAIVSLLVTHFNNKRNLKFLEEKDKHETEQKRIIDEMEISKDKRYQQRAYNRLSSGLLKLYNSYIKHRCLYAGNQRLDVVEINDTFIEDIAAFKTVYNKEVDIIPEYAISLFELVDTLNRFVLLKDILEKEQDLVQNNGHKKLKAKRAVMDSLSALLDKEFVDILDQISDKADISEPYKRYLKDNSPESYVANSLKIQQEMIKRMEDSFRKQTNSDVG